METIFYEVIPRTLSFVGAEALTKSARHLTSINARDAKPLLALWPEYVIKLAKPQKNITDYFAFGSFRICSSKCKELIKTLESDIEYLPVRVISFNGAEMHGSPYWLMHHLSFPDCVDKHLSDITFYCDINFVDEVRVLVFNSNVSDHNYFSPIDMLEIYATTTFKSAVENSKLTGFTFLRV